jgi:hypothetical protein
MIRCIAIPARWVPGGRGADRGPTQETTMAHPAFTIDQIMAEIKTGRERRAQHGGPEPTWPERLVAEIERLRMPLQRILSGDMMIDGVEYEPWQLARDALK